MDIDELQTVQSRERQTDSLQQLRDSFYAEASEFIQQLRDARDDAAQRADDPWDNPEVNRLSDEIKTAEQTVEAIYDRRVGKIVKKASLAAADMPTDEDGLTDEEQALFERLVDSIEESRDHVLDMVAGDVEPGTSPVEAGTGSTTEATQTAPEPSSPPRDTPRQSPEPEDDPDPQPTPPEAGTDGVSAADVMDAGESSPSEAPSRDGGHDPPVEPRSAEADPEPNPDSPPSKPPQTEQSETDDVDRETVRITKDVGEILGVDQREYDLSTDDVVTLPADNAEPLVRRDAATKLD